MSTPPGSGAGRAALTITGLTAVSRVTGLIRVLVVTAVLGDTFLGDTYQTANTVPNVLFELLAAGALQAVLVPALVSTHDREGGAGADRLAGQVLGLLLTGLGVVAAIAMLAAPLAMRVLTVGVDDPAVQADQRALGTFFLVLFAPQLVCYAAGAVATGALHARQHFAAPAIAPAVNNAVVIAAYLVFDAMRDGAAPSLDLTTGERLVLALGTTLGVVALAAVPVLAAHRAGMSVRPRRARFASPALRSLGHQASWAAAFLAATQVLALTVLVLANGPGGQVVAYQFGFTLFLLPFALVATPIATALFPGLARLGADPPAFAATWQRGLVATVVLLAPAAAAMVALARPIAELTLAGAVERPEAIAHTLAALGPGLVGFAVYLLATRAWYAVGEARHAAVVNGAVVGAGVIAMVVASAAAADSDRAAALAGAHSAVYLGGAVVLVAGLVRRPGASVSAPALVRPVASAIAAGAVAAVVMAAVAAAVPGAGRAGAAADVALAGAAGLGTYAVVARLLAGPLRALVRLDAPPPVGAPAVAT